VERIDRKKCSVLLKGRLNTKLFEKRKEIEEYKALQKSKYMATYSTILLVQFSSIKNAPAVASYPFSTLVL